MKKICEGCNKEFEAESESNIYCSVDCACSEVEEDYNEAIDKETFKKEFQKTLDEMYSIMERKNADYSKGGAFDNFELVEKLGITTVEKGILVRMSDKMSRIVTLLDQDAQVKDEAITDTLQDLANYSVILKLYLDNK